MYSHLSIGTVLNSGRNTYVIESVIGHGTFGITYTAKICNKTKTVAIKEFFINGVSSREKSGFVSAASDTISTEQCQAEFIAEAKNLIELHHPNIVKAYEVFEANGTVYYSMEYIEGENLNSYLKHKNLTLDEAVSIITKIAYGLSYMHESRHMLHLDLKPGNIMRRYSDGQIILIDFGLSRYFTDEEMPEGKSPVGLGTKGYAPVEQSEYQTRGRNFNATIDIYSLGATFYKLLTGETPPPATELKEKPELLKQLLDSLNLPSEKKDIIEKAMNPVLEKRYQSVMSFIYDINAEERKRRKKNLLLSLSIFAGVIAICIIILYVIQKQKTAKRRAYDEKKEFAFELVEAIQGANHYGEVEYYKFFSDGSGLYLFESWHDNMDCDDLECELESKTDTARFVYNIINGNRLLFGKNPKGLSSYYEQGQITQIVLLPEERKIHFDKNEYNLYLNDESVNWNEVSKICD